MSEYTLLGNSVCALQHRTSHTLFALYTLCTQAPSLFEIMHVEVIFTCSGSSDYCQQNNGNELHDRPASCNNKPTKNNNYDSTVAVTIIADNTVCNLHIYACVQPC